MHFQPLKEISENLEESVTRTHNLALFSRLLGSPSPTGFMSGALRRTSAQLHRLTRSVSPDPSFSDDEDEDEEEESAGTAGSVPSGLGLDTTESTICSFGGLVSTCPPLSGVEFLQQDGRGEEKNERMLEKDSLVPKIPPPTV